MKLDGAKNADVAHAQERESCACSAPQRLRGEESRVKGMKKDTVFLKLDG